MNYSTDTCQTDAFQKTKAQIYNYSFLKLSILSVHGFVCFNMSYRILKALLQWADSKMYTSK